MAAALKELGQFHAPPGLCGFVLTQPPAAGTLGQSHDLGIYDFIWRMGEGDLQIVIGRETTQQDLGRCMRESFARSGSFVIAVYNFETRLHRLVRVRMPPGKSNAILGVVVSKIPHEEEEEQGGEGGGGGGMGGGGVGAPEPGLDLYTAGYRCVFCGAFLMFLYY